MSISDKCCSCKNLQNMINNLKSDGFSEKEIEDFCDEVFKFLDELKESTIKYLLENGV